MWRRNFLKFLSVLPVCPWNIKLPKVNNFKSEFYAYETIDIRRPILGPIYQVPLYPTSYDKKIPINLSKKEDKITIHIHHGEITVPEEVLELLSLDILKMIGA